MSEVKIVITAETAQAAAQLQAFAAQAGSGLKALTEHGAGVDESFHQMRESAMTLREGFHTLEATAMVFGSVRMPELVEAMTAVRVGMMATRSAAMLLGTTMAAIAPYTIAIAATVGAGALAWSHFNAEIKESEEYIGKMVKALNEVPGIMDRIQALQKAGLTSPQAAQRYADMLNPNKLKYVDGDGNLTDSPGQNVQWTDSGSDPISGVNRGSRQQSSFVPNKEATAEFKNKKVLDAIEIYSDAQVKARIELTDLEKKAHEENLSAVQQEIDAIKEKYKVQRDEMVKAAQSSGALEGDYRGVSAGLADINTAEQRALVDAAQKRQDEMVRKQQESANAEREMAAKRGAATLQAVEDQITAMSDLEGKKRGEQYKEEFNLRISAAQSAYFSGDIAEQEYTHLVEEAAHKRTEAEKAYNAELAKSAQLKQEIYRAEIEAQLKGIQGNPFLTDGQKQDQSLPLMKELMSQNATRMSQLDKQAQDPAQQLEAEKQKLQIMEQQAQLSDKIAQAEHPWATAFAKLSSQAEINMRTLAATFQNVFNSAVHSISSGITGLIEGTKTWGQALRQIGNDILNEIISAIVQMGVRWVLTQIMMAVMGKTILAASTAAIAPIAAAQSAIWATPATLATIASYGSAAISAPGFIAAADAMTMGLAAFESGGYTGAGAHDDVAGIVHRGEYVMPADVVDRVGVGNLEALHRGGSPAATAAAASGGSSRTNIHNAVYFNAADMVNTLQKSDAHEKYIVDVMSKNIHKFR